MGGISFAGTIRHTHTASSVQGGNTFGQAAAPNNILGHASFQEQAVDPPAVAGRFQTYAKDVAGTSQYFGRSDDGTIHQITPPPTGAGSVIPYAPATTHAAGLTRFVAFGALGTDDNTVNFVCPRGGTLTNLVINSAFHSASGGAGTTFELRRSPSCNAAYAVTVLSIAIADGVSGCFVDSDTVAVSQSERINLRVTNLGLSGVISYTGGLEYQ
ncbi:MAG: hypothetical protein ACE5JI_04560 [Acidobacteriota bacterium]